MQELVVAPNVDDGSQEPLLHNVGTLGYAVTRSNSDTAASPGQHLMQAQMDKYGAVLFQKVDGYYRCFFAGCGKKLQANFSRHVAKHEQEGDAQDEVLIKSVKESLPSEGVPTQQCANPHHQEYWGTNPELPVTEFYKRSHKCKKCYIRQQMERKRNRGSEPDQTLGMSADGEIKQETPKKRNKESDKHTPTKANDDHTSVRSKTMKDDSLTTQGPLDLHSVLLTGNDQEMGATEEKPESFSHDGVASGYVNLEIGPFHVTGFLEGIGLTVQTNLGGRSYKGFLVNQSPDTTTQSTYEKITESVTMGNEIIMSDIEVRQLVATEPPMPTNAGNNMVVDHHLNIMESSVAKDLTGADTFNHHHHHHHM